MSALLPGWQLVIQRNTSESLPAFVMLTGTPLPHCWLHCGCWNSGVSAELNWGTVLVPEVFWWQLAGLVGPGTSLHCFGVRPSHQISLISWLLWITRFVPEQLLP